jgi:hypothetical protein
MLFQILQDKEYRLSENMIPKRFCQYKASVSDVQQMKAYVYSFAAARAAVKFQLGRRHVARHRRRCM